MRVKNYAPELLDIFKLGSQKEFRFDCKTKRKANALRARLHACRRRMREEKHWLLPAAEATVISLDGSTLIAHPPDSDLKQALAEALKEQGLPQEKL